MSLDPRLLWPTEMLKTTDDMPESYHSRMAGELPPTTPMCQSHERKQTRVLLATLE